MRGWILQKWNAAARQWRAVYTTPFEQFRWAVACGREKALLDDYPAAYRVVRA
jgi:hypothetical protein